MHILQAPGHPVRKARGYTLRLRLIFGILLWFHHDNANSGDYSRDAVAPGKPIDATLSGRLLNFTAPGDDLLFPAGVIKNLDPANLKVEAFDPEKITEAVKYAW